jgi:hypothetical protein
VSVCGDGGGKGRDGELRVVMVVGLDKAWPHAMRYRVANYE